MALNTYTTLVAGIEAWLEEDGSEFTAAINDIIDLAEKRLARDLDLEIFRRTNSSVSMVVGAATITKPTISSPDLLIAIKQIWISGGALTGIRMLERRSENVVLDYNSGAANGVPKYYADESETVVRFAPPPGATYTVNIRYLSRPQPLSSSNETNWFSTYAYDILFKAALAEAEKFIVAEERAPVWEKDYLESLAMAKRELYNLYGTQYDRLSAVPVPQAPRSRE
jgi:hypothetical protein